MIIIGLPQLMTKLAALPIMTEKAAEVGKVIGANHIALRAREIVEVRTGQTRATIHVEDGNVIAGGAAIFLELGTSKMPAEPFLGPAFEQKQDQVVDDVANAVRVVLARL